MPKGENPRTRTNADVFNKYEGGVAEDTKARLEVPFWKILQNVWIKDDNELHGRPHAHDYFGLANPVGIACTHENEPVILADGSVYVDGTIKGSFTGSGPVSYDISFGKTVITAGGIPLTWDGSSVTPLVHTDVKAVALAYGPSKSRLWFVKNSDPRTLYFTNRGNWDDVGTIVTDSFGNTDLKTEGGRYKGWNSDIIDIIEFLGDLVVFTKRGIFRLVFSAKEGLMYAIKDPVADVEVWDVKPIRFSTGIYFINRRGPHVYSIGDRGPFVQALPLRRNTRTFQKELVEAEAKLGVDEDRGLFFIKTKNSAQTWVMHTDAENVMTRWDLSFEDLKTVNGLVYMTDSSNAYELKDEGDGQNFYDIIVRSGLNAFGNVIIKKRMDMIGAFVNMDKKGSYYLGFLADGLYTVPWVPTKFPKLYTGPQGKDTLIRLNETNKTPFSVGAFHFIFRNYGEFILHDIYAVWVEKDRFKLDSA